MILDFIILTALAGLAWALGRFRGLTEGHDEALSGLVHMTDDDFQRAIVDLRRLRDHHNRCRRRVSDVPRQG